MHARSLPNWVGILAYEKLHKVLASSFDQDSVSFEKNMTCNEIRNKKI